MHVYYDTTEVPSDDAQNVDGISSSLPSFSTTHVLLEQHVLRRGSCSPISKQRRQLRPRTLGLVTLILLSAVLTLLFHRICLSWRIFQAMDFTQGDRQQRHRLL